ncbi:hypothetical protein ACOTVP_08770 [Aliarcobacter butzleri]
MKILNITNGSSNFLCTLTYEEMKLITGGKLYSDEFKSICNSNKDIDLSLFNKLPLDYDIRNVNQAINNLEGAIKFLNNKKESLEYINSLKEIK